MKYEFETMTIGDCCDIIKKSIYPEKGQVYTCFSLPAFDNSNTPEILNGEEIKSSKFVLDENTILFNKLNPKFRRVWNIHSLEKYENTICSTEFLPLKAKANIEQDYLYYYISSPYFTRLMDGIRTGTSNSQQRIDWKQFLREQINVPSLPIQRKVVLLLSNIDKKIKLNNKINNNLEQQAQAIFKECFIDNPENNEWSTGTFSELIKSTLNGDWGKEAPTGNNTEKVYCIRGADIPEVKAGNKGKMPTRYILPKNFATKQLTAGDIVVEISGGSPTQSTGRCTAITQSLLDRYDSSMVCTNFCKAMKPKEGYSLFIYYYWQYLYGKGVFFSYENGTTGIKNLDFSGFIETETILIPPVDKVLAFDDYCKAIFNQIFANGKQNEHLAVLRDTLLPKLMSGELDVSDIDL